MSYLQPCIVEFPSLTISNRVTCAPRLLHKRIDLPLEEKAKDDSFGKTIVSFIVGFRRIELAILALRLAGLGFV